MNKYLFIIVVVFCVVLPQGCSRNNIDVLRVGYEEQEAPTFCQSAALSMLISYETQRNIDQKSIFGELERCGGHTSHTARISYLKEHLKGYRVKFRYINDRLEAWQSIVASLKRGDPVVLSTRLTRSGHVIVVIGATVQNGKRILIAHDPAGRFDFLEGKFDLLQTGAAVEYPFDAMYVKNRQVRLDRLNGTSGLALEGYCVGERVWFSIEDKTVAPLRPRLSVVKELKDWEFVEIEKANHEKSD